MAINIRDYFIRDINPVKGLLTAEWIAMGYLLLTLLMMTIMWPKLIHPESMLWGRFLFVASTLAAWGVYRLFPCRLALLARVVLQMAYLSWWYPDTYELNRALPNLDHFFASCEQFFFGCQPSLLFSQYVPWGWFSELMCMGYVSYFPLMTLLLLYYFFQRHNEFLKAAFVVLGSFFAYYVVFILLPVTGPQFYYLAVGSDQIAQGIFPDLGDWFLTHSERMAAPGWKDGFFYHLLDLTHDAGERPTAAFPSSHVGVTTIIMLLALRTRCKWLVLTIMPFYVLMCLSTVYIYAHYAIDALAGLVTGTLIYFLLLRLYPNKE
ncbi:MAG: phosphatase PAP2 family protein [Prevotella sp.]|nr:phosphatase PAP2 family protein [Prevotella sp.]